MDVQNKQNGNRGVFFIGTEDNHLGEMTYKLKSPGIMVIEHTEVSDELRGQNAGYALVQAGVDYARANSLKILPLCSFAAAVFKKKAEYNDVWLQHSES